MTSRDNTKMSCRGKSAPAKENDPLLLTKNPALTPATASTDGNQDGQNDNTQANQDDRHKTDDDEPPEHPYSRYASKKVLGRYIPEIDENHALSKTRKSAASKQTTMLRNQLIAASIICLANVIILACVWVYFPPDTRDIGTLRMGDCSEMMTINSLIHVVLNVLSSLFLGTGSYCMQILVAPSRREMDAAHANGVSLDIGIQSFRNLRWIKRRRIFQWLGLGILSTCLHLFWNSLTFTSTPVVSYATATVTSDFQELGRDWALDPLPPVLINRDWSPIHDIYTEMANFTRLNKEDCIDAYISPLNSKKPVVLVASNVTAAENHNQTLISGWFTGWDVWSRSAWWICNGYDPDSKLLCSKEWASTFGDDWSVIATVRAGTDGLNRPLWVNVDYCLVGVEKDISRRCGLHYGAQIFTIVSVCTFLQCCFIAVVWWSSRSKAGLGQRERNMVLVGDAIAEYLEHPGDASASQTVRMHPQIWRPQRRIPWFNTVSRRIWACSLTLFTLGIAAPMAVLIDSVTYWQFKGLKLTLPTILHLGFGLNPNFIGLHTETKNYSLIQCVFLANFVHIVVSFLYLFYNNILTHQLVADQWARFLRPDGKKALRVSAPLRMQRSSYILSLPLAYSAVLTVAMVLLHWLVSQSLFVVQTIGFDTAGRKMPPSIFNGSSVGYALLPIVLATVVGVIMVVALLVNSFARSHRLIPLEFLAWGSSSAHIESLCHRPYGDEDAHLFPLSIGIVGDRGGVSATGAARLAFSTDVGLGEPREGSLYILPVRKENIRGTGRMFGQV